LLCAVVQSRTITRVVQPRPPPGWSSSHELNRLPTPPQATARKTANAFAGRRGIKDGFAPAIFKTGLMCRQSVCRGQFLEGTFRKGIPAPGRPAMNPSQLNLAQQSMEGVPLGHAVLPGYSFALANGSGQMMTPSFGGGAQSTLPNVAGRTYLPSITPGFLGASSAESLSMNNPSSGSYIPRGGNQTWHVNGHAGELNGHMRQHSSLFGMATSWGSDNPVNGKLESISSAFGEAWQNHVDNSVKASFQASHVAEPSLAPEKSFPVAQTFQSFPQHSMHRPENDAFGLLGNSASQSVAMETWSAALLNPNRNPPLSMNGHTPLQSSNGQTKLHHSSAEVHTNGSSQNIKKTLKKAVSQYIYNAVDR
jgi:hypothetical protein